MTKYLIFIRHTPYYPGYGLDDLVAVADTLEEAEDSVRMLAIEANLGKDFRITKLNLDDDTKPMVEECYAGEYLTLDSEVTSIVYRTGRPL